MRVFVRATPSGQHLVAICQFSGFVVVSAAHRSFGQLVTNIIRVWSEGARDWLRFFPHRAKKNTSKSNISRLEPRVDKTRIKRIFNNFPYVMYFLYYTVLVLTPKRRFNWHLYIRECINSTTFCFDAKIPASFFFLTLCATQLSSGIIFPPLQHALVAEIN